MKSELLLVIVVLSELICLGSSSSNRRFIQISDLHLDLGYTAGSSIKNMCHNSSQVFAEADGGASKYGDFKCDAPKKLVMSAIRYLQKIEPNPDFILWSGDSSPHWWDDANHTWSEVYNNLKIITRELHLAFPNATIIPALGNHDSSPADSFSDPGIDPAGAKRIYSGYIEEGSFGDLLRDFPEAKAKFKECGYYTVKQKNYFKENITQTFIVLNTNLYYNNKAKTNESDPCGQFKWLEGELRNAKDNERIFIIAHVPPGFFELYPAKPFFDSDNHTNMYSKILSEKRAAQKVVAHFYGHMHTDAVRLFMGNDDDVRGVGFAAPSVTPLMFEGGVNPSVRIYDYNPENRIIVDYETHYLPLDRLTVHEGPLAVHDEDTENTADVTDTDDIIDEEDSDSSSGEAKSRRKNSKFLDRKKRQQLSNVAKSTTALPSNDDDSFENLAIDGPTTKQAISSNSTTLPSMDSDIVENTTTLPEKDVTTLLPAIEVSTNMTSNVKNINNLTKNSTAKLLSTNTPSNQPSNSSKTMLTNLTTETSMINVTDTSKTNATESSSANLTNSDPDVDFLVSQWTLGYRKQVDLGVENLSPKNVYKAYMKMKQDQSGPVFKKYFRQTWVLHDPKDRMNCNQTCHNIYMCAVVHFTVEDFFDCVNSGGSIIESPPYQDTVTTVSSSRGTTSSMYQRPGSWQRTTSRPSAALTTNRSPYDTVLDSDSVEIEAADSKDGQSGVVRGIAIGFAGIALIAIAAFSFAFYRKTRINRYRSQEFLLTDSVFRYDGYSQVDQP